MHKLPVFRTFGNALGFTIGNFFTIFRLSWLPFTAFLAANFVLGFYLQDLVGHKLVDPFTIFAHIDDIFFLQVVTGILQLIVIAAVAVSIHRVILFGDRNPGSYFNFPFGTTEFLYALMAVLTGTIIVAILAAALAPVIFVVAHGDLRAFFAQIATWAADWPKNLSAVSFVTLAPIMFAYFVGWIIALYVCLRLAVWPPAVVATRRLSFGEAWRLTEGNVARMFGLFFLSGFILWVAVAFLAGAAYWYYTSHMGAGHFPAAPDVGSVPATPSVAPDPKDVAAAQELARHNVELEMEKFQPYAPLFWLFELLVNIIGTGFGVALLSYSYKALKGYEAREPIPQDG